jgi:hypothetical protein
MPQIVEAEVICRWPAGPGHAAQQNQKNAGAKLLASFINTL